MDRTRYTQWDRPSAMLFDFRASSWTWGSGSVSLAIAETGIWPFDPAATVAFARGPRLMTTAGQGADSTM